MKTRFHRGSIVGLLVLLTLGAAATSAEQAPTREDLVVVVVNRNVPHSLELARYYRKARGIPELFEIALDCSVEETISWEHFLEKIHNPLLEALLDRGWMRGEPVDGPGAHGRPPVRIVENQVDFLVLMSGIPLRIENHAPLLEGAGNPPGAFRTSRAAVDSELATLPALDSPIAGAIPNPFFRESHPRAIDPTLALRVTRLDGPDRKSIRGLIDRAIQAEAEGLRGRAYLDMGGPHELGDHWLSRTQEMLSGLGFDSDVESSKSRFGLSHRFDAPAFYFGWYHRDLDGVFQLPGFVFPPGAIGFHIHSTSAHTLRSRRKGWAGPLIARGITATAGNVFEPYLEMSHYPQMMVAGLQKGMRWGEAAYYSLPVLSWQSIAIGDPLYQPFAHPLSSQMLAGPHPGDPLSQYSMIRTLNRLEDSGRPEVALKLGMRWFEQQPGIALALHLIPAMKEREDDLAFLLNVLSLVRQYEIRDIGLALKVASTLENHGSAESALELLQSLSNMSGLPDELVHTLQEKGRSLATRHGLQTPWME